MSFLGFGASKSKTTMDPRSRATWYGNIDQANNLAAFQGMTPTYLAAFRDPYEDQAVRAAQSDLEYQRQLAALSAGDAASAAGAYGGTRHAVSEALTNAEFARQGAAQAAQMRSQGHWQALQLALQQLLAQNQYGLDRQGAINNAVSLLRPNSTTTELSAQGQLSFGGGGGGGSASAPSNRYAARIYSI